MPADLSSELLKDTALDDAYRGTYTVPADLSSELLKDPWYRENISERRWCPQTSLRNC